MSSLEIRVRLSEPVRTTERLVRALQLDPPSMFKGVNSPIDDYRVLSENPHFSNYFTHNRMFAWVEELFNKDGCEKSRGKARIFGETIETTTFEAKRRGLPVAKAVYYATGVKKQDLMVPAATFGLYGPQPDNPLAMLGIELTQFVNYHTDEELSVYKIITPHVESLAHGGNMGNKDFSVEDILEEKIKQNIRLCIGDTGWVENDQLSVIEKFGLSL